MRVSNLISMWGPLLPGRLFSQKVKENQQKGMVDIFFLEVGWGGECLFVFQVHMVLVQMFSFWIVLYKWGRHYKFGKELHTNG